MSYTIKLVCTEISAEATIFTLNFPTIKFNDVDKTDVIVQKIFDTISSSSRLQSYKSALLELLETVI